ncbi:hypothetical protein BJF79_16415 [Actinomadura sp. CNU-125]|nr:hypothetical protein BJF79_16415 [Actinomadura sp. CNU-125]
MLLGLTAPTAGTATVLGRPAGDPRSLARTGLLIEEPALYPYLSGRDNLLVVGRYTSVGATRVARLLEVSALSWHERSLADVSFELTASETGTPTGSDR